MTQTFDPVWNELYSGGRSQRYPWDCIVSFVYRCAPRDRPRESVKILEVGFGTGGNLWFAAREGFSVAGVEGSQTAVDFAQARFRDEGLVGDLRLGDYTDLPFDDGCFDLVIDRGALTCTGRNGMQQAVDEIARVMRPGGVFHFNPYADDHTSARSGRAGEDGVTVDIRAGTLVGVGQICFLDERQVQAMLSGPWVLHQLERCASRALVGPSESVHSEWRAIVERC